VPPPLVFFGALRVKMRDEGPVRNYAVYVEDAKFWLCVMIARPVLHTKFRTVPLPIEQTLLPAFSSSSRLIRILCSIVAPLAALMATEPRSLGGILLSTFVPILTHP
jgi:hypothetical protein